MTSPNALAQIIAQRQNQFQPMPPQQPWGGQTPGYPPMQMPAQGMPVMPVGGQPPLAVQAQRPIMPNGGMAQQYPMQPQRPMLNGRPMQPANNFAQGGGW